MYIIVPCAGRSSRYPNLRPKWMLTQPNGELMVKEALKGLEIKADQKIILTILKEHEAKYGVCKALKESFGKNVDVCILDQPTNSQPETVYRTILAKRLPGNSAILVKDSDNFFEIDKLKEKYSYVTISSLNDHSNINPRNKSYVVVNENGIIREIVEKRVISDLFSIGGYFFRRCGDFVDAYKALLKTSKGEFYVSDIIGYLISKGEIFLTKRGAHYIDWGTVKEWNRYKMHQKTFIVDLDGVLVESSARHFKPYWGTTKAIENNVSAVNRLKEKGNQIIIFTSRTSDYRQITVRQLEKIGLKYDALIMDALHNQRILVNDFSRSNPFPSAMAINVERDTDQLCHFLVDMELSD